MREKLDSDQGKAIYGHRKHIVEPVFGQIKSVMGFTSFLLRGLQKVKGEFNLVAIAHNLRKIWLHLKAGNKNNVKNRLTMVLLFSAINSLHQCSIYAILRA